MTVALQSVAPVAPVTIPGPVHLAFDAIAKRDTVVDVDYSIVYAPGIIFPNGTSLTSVSSQSVRTSQTTIALDTELMTTGPHYPNLIIHADVREAGALQFHVAWSVPVRGGAGFWDQQLAAVKPAPKGKA